MNSKCAVEEEKWFPKLLAKYEGVIAMNGESRVAFFNWGTFRFEDGKIYVLTFAFIAKDFYRMVQGGGSFAIPRSDMQHCSISINNVKITEDLMDAIVTAILEESFP